MKALVLMLIALPFLADAGNTDFHRHAFTLSSGIPGIILPELGYEYSISSNNKIAAGVGSFLIVPEYRVSYIGIAGPFEFTSGLGFVSAFDNDDDDLADIFEDLLSLGTDGTVFLSGTAGFRYTADCGFIFRLAGGAGYFMGDDESFTLPFMQLGLGYGF